MLKLSMGLELDGKDTRRNIIFKSKEEQTSGA